MAEFVLNEMDRIQQANNFRKKKLEEIKTKTIKEIVYSNEEVPNTWKKKADYKNLIHKITSCDEGFLLYLGNTKEKIESTYRDTTHKSTNSKVVIKENGRIQYPNYLGNNNKDLLKQDNDKRFPHLNSEKNINKLCSSNISNSFNESFLDKPNKSHHYQNIDTIESGNNLGNKSKTSNYILKSLNIHDLNKNNKYSKVNRETDTLSKNNFSAIDSPRRKNSTYSENSNKELNKIIEKFDSKESEKISNKVVGRDSFNKTHQVRFLSSKKNTDYYDKKSHLKSKKSMSVKNIITDFYMGNTLELGKDMKRLQSAKKSVKQRFIEASKFMLI